LIWKSIIPHGPKRFYDWIKALCLQFHFVCLFISHLISPFLIKQNCVMHNYSSIGSHDWAIFVDKLNHFSWGDLISFIWGHLQNSHKFMGLSLENVILIQGTFQSGKMIQRKKENTTLYLLSSRDLQTNSCHMVLATYIHE
jgi:hypothetical protein